MGLRSSTLLIIIFILGITITLGLSELYTGVIAPAFSPPPTINQQYIQAIKDTMTTQTNQITTGLTPITLNNTDLKWQGQGDNATVLMVTWTRFLNSYPINQTITTTWGDTWVTAAPELQTFFKNNVNPGTNVTVRAAQLLGMPANTSDTYFVELWVKPESLFRPTGDNEITDSTAQMNLPANATAEYKAWFNSNILASYYPMKFPWTRLGYTYDWGSSNHFGLSEFVLSQDSTAIVKSVTPTVEYLKIGG